MTSWRWPGVVGLNVLSAMPLDSRRHVDGLAFGQGDHRLLEIAALAAPAPEHLLLALLAKGVHRRHLDLEQALDRGLDLRLGRLERHAEGHLAMAGHLRRLLG